eukprot:3269969-Ditylum_brightwellii.AAC.1
MQIQKKEPPPPPPPNMFDESLHQLPSWEQTVLQHIYEQSNSFTLWKPAPGIGIFWMGYCNRNSNPLDRLWTCTRQPIPPRITMYRRHQPLISPTVLIIVDTVPQYLHARKHMLPLL